MKFYDYRVSDKHVGHIDELVADVEEGSLKRYPIGHRYEGKPRGTYGRTPRQLEDTLKGMTLTRAIQGVSRLSGTGTIACERCLRRAEKLRRG